MSATNSVLQDIRTAAQQKNFLQNIFKSGNTGLTSAYITQEFRAVCALAGVSLPTDVLIGLDTAQIVMAGGVFVDDLAIGQSLQQAANPGLLAVNGAVNLLSDLGIVDHQAADFVGLGVNLALTLSSGGLNVLADLGCVLSLISCVCDLSQDFGGSQAEAISQAKKALSVGVKAVLDPQIANASAAASAYTKGTLNFFDFVASIAIQSPVEFKSFFPTLAVYFPTWITETITATGESDGWTSSKYDTETYQFSELMTSAPEVQTVLLNHFIVEPMQKFSQYKTVNTKISIKAMSILSMLLSTTPKGPVQMDLNFDVLTACGLLGLTPAILGDDWLFKGLQREENIISDWADFLPYQPILYPLVEKPTTALVINNQPYFTDAEKAQSDAADGLVAIQKYMQTLDQKGDIGALMKIPEAVAMLKRWADIRLDPTYDPSSGEVDNMTLKPNSVSITKQPGFVRGNNDDATWAYIKANYTIEIDDYWKCLGVLKTMEAANLYKNEEPLLQSYGSLDQITDGFKNVYLFTLAKNLNRLARQNLANSLGIPLDSLGTRTNPDGTTVYYQKVG